VLGPLAIAKVQPRDIERLVGAIDAKVIAGDLSAKSAKNILGTCSKMFDDATHAKPGKGLRCLEKDPTDGVRGPDDDDPDKALQFLYPSEFLTFIECRTVPQRWRRNLAIAVYLCLRDGEQRALKWPAVDLEHGVVTIAETFDRRTSADREGTKGGAARVVPIPEALRPLLVAMKEEHDKGHVCVMSSLRDMARGLRRWLTHAGVTRPELHKSTPLSKPLRWHDARATGLTWLAVQGRSSTEIRDLAGHTQTSMTDRYMRAAGVLRGGRFGLPFPHHYAH
jgi:integrase